VHNFQRLKAILAEQLIDEWLVCLVALQGDQAGMSDIVVAALEAIAITSVTGIAGDAPQAAVRGCPAWLESMQYNPRRAEEDGHGGSPLSPGSLMTVPRPTPCR